MSTNAYDDMEFFDPEDPTTDFDNLEGHPLMVKSPDNGVEGEGGEGMDPNHVEEHELPAETSVSNQRKSHTGARLLTRPQSIERRQLALTLSAGAFGHAASSTNSASNFGHLASTVDRPTLNNGASLLGEPCVKMNPDGTQSWDVDALVRSH